MVGMSASEAATRPTPLFRMAELFFAPEGLLRVVNRDFSPWKALKRFASRRNAGKGTGGPMESQPALERPLLLTSIQDESYLYAPPSAEAAGCSPAAAGAQRQLNPTENRCKVLIVDDSILVRRTLTQLINQHEGLVVCGHAADVDEGAETAVRLKPDLAIVDLALGDGNSLQLVRQLHDRLPDTRILVLSMHEEDVFASPVLRAGANGFVMKQKASQHLFEAIRAVLAGQVYLSNSPP